MAEPTHRIPLEILMVIVGLFEILYRTLLSPEARMILDGYQSNRAKLAPFGVVWDIGSKPLWYISGLIGVICLIALLFRHRTWRWLAPLVVVLNVLPMSATLGIVALYSYATRSRRRSPTVVVLLIAIVTMLINCLPLHPLGDRVVVTAAICLGLTCVTILGMYTETRRLLLAQLRSRVAAAETDQRIYEEQARRSERTRIAREMHDIVAHKISLVALQAGGLEMNPGIGRDQVENTAGLIRSTATEALHELRQVLGVLRQEGDEKPLAPQPTWEDVRRLVDGSKEAGIHVELFDFVDSPVPNALARTVYRVVQESLTNIHKHARHTAARVALLGEPGEDLVVEVSNVLPTGYHSELPGARMGLSGIEARVAHAGGTMTSGPTDDGRFEVKAVIPWTKPTASSESD
ncbi:sensor histidine kinase [Devriesea agamarum]|uniref:sensor histidine kinase n=1 Tax=Devriesea agamarum TaxID=472569 RepID=UPI000A83C804|nr:histidine kinase [Devriesea agamarum]